jgi:hypothetical protein
MNFSKTLIDESRPWGYIKFIHKDGEIHEFFSAVNRMTGDRLSGFDNKSPYIDRSIKWPKSVFRDIFTKSKKVLEFEGDILEK